MEVKAENVRGKIESSATRSAAAAATSSPEFSLSKQQTDGGPRLKKNMKIEST
jgi:hypothetical protein